MAKFKNAEEAKNALPELKENKKITKLELKQYCKEQKLEMEDAEGNLINHGEHKEDKVAKKWSKLAGAFNKASKALEDAKTFMESKKERKAPGGKLSGKYEYPVDCTTSDARKKFRAAARAAAKKSAKAEAKVAEKTSHKESSKKKTKTKTKNIED